MRKYFISLIILLILIPTIVNGSDKFKVTFDSCVDGDTAKFVLNGKVITARFLAVDTPETNHPKLGEQPYGKEASNYTCTFLKNSKLIELEYDSNSSKQDKYNRHLVWIWTDNSLFQKNLIIAGLAKIDYIYGKYQYLDELKELEAIVKEQKLKIWNNNVEIKEDNSSTYLLIFMFSVVILIGSLISKEFREFTFKAFKKEGKKLIKSLK